MNGDRIPVAQTGRGCLILYRPQTLPRTQAVAVMHIDGPPAALARFAAARPDREPRHSGRALHTITVAEAACFDTTAESHAGANPAMGECMSADLALAKRVG